MNEQELRSLIECARSEFKMLGYSDGEIEDAMMFMTTLIMVLYSSHFAHMSPIGVALFPNDLPVMDKRFPDILRVAANTLEIYIEKVKQEKKNEN